MTRRRLLDTPLGQVHVVEAGAGPGTPILLLHQTPRSSDEFAEVLPLLADRRRTLAVDTPGYGCSDPVAGEPEVADYAAAVTAVMDGLGLGQAVVVGHHTGAVIAVELAAGHPRRVERVVLSGPVYTDAAGRAELLRHFQQWRVQPDGSHLQAKWDKFAAWLADPELVQRCLRDLWRAGGTSEQGHFAVARYAMEERLPLVRCPALLLFHRRDPFTDPERARPLREAFRPAAQAFLDAGVFAANEKPAEFAAAVLDYLGEGASPHG